ncbi:FecR family protein [Porphyromonadaceae sp. NP-X]|jgi:ferric-dicitrate binding protein FerR (iron transport regulator)|nr:FecR family protein [Porphyromonadaceae sp. NP-X]
MDNYLKILYKKFLYNVISKDEFLEMKHNINNLDDNELGDLFKEEWDESISFTAFDEQSKKDVKKNLSFYIATEQNQRSNIKKTKQFIRIAAVLIPFIVVIGWIIFKQPSNKEQNAFEVAVARGNKALVTLPDQSKVWINSNSTLEYKNGNKNTREVKLSGEAFFKVSKDEKRPFIVSAKDLQVEVLGTSFNVKARQASDIVETSLVEGKIKIQSPFLSQDYYLQPNEKAIYTQSQKQLQILKTDNDLEIAWKDNKLKFSSERFIDVLGMIEDWYGVKIVCKCPEIENDLISGTLKDENLETALEALKIQYKIQYKRYRDTIIIYK